MRNSRAARRTRKPRCGLEATSSRLRDIWFGAVWRAVAGIVVEETPERSVFWVPAGAESAYPVDDDGDEIRIPRPEFRQATRRTKAPIVVVCDEGAPWTLWLFFARIGSFDRWYVNFERYLGRSAIAYDSRRPQARPDRTSRAASSSGRTRTSSSRPARSGSSTPTRSAATPSWSSPSTLADGLGELHARSGLGRAELPAGWDSLS